MKNKFIGIKAFQSKLSESFPQPGEVTFITKRNIPTYTLSALSSQPGTFFASTQDVDICPRCGQVIPKEVKKDADTD